MAVLLKYGSLIPLAVRVALATGAAYGTVKYDVWTDSSKSKENLEKVKGIVQREIEYPKTIMNKYRKSTDSSSSISSSSLIFSPSTAPPTSSSPPSFLPTVQAAGVRGWDRMVMNTCHYLTSVDGSQAVKRAGEATQSWAKQQFSSK